MFLKTDFLVLPSGPSENLSKSMKILFTDWIQGPGHLYFSTLFTFSFKVRSLVDGEMGK